MKKLFLTLAMLFMGMAQQAYAEDDKTKIPDEQKWKITENCDSSTPQLY